MLRGILEQLNRVSSLLEYGFFAHVYLSPEGELKREVKGLDAAGNPATVPDPWEFRNLVEAGHQAFVIRYILPKEGEEANATTQKALDKIRVMMSKGGKVGGKWKGRAIPKGVSAPAPKRLPREVYTIAVVTSSTVKDSKKVAEKEAKKIWWEWLKTKGESAGPGKMEVHIEPYQG